MMRCAMLGCTLVFCSMVIGCATETHDELIRKTIAAMEDAGNHVGNIRKRVDDAVKKAGEAGESPKLDLTAAGKAAEELKKAGEEFQKIKRQVEQVRSQISDADRKLNAENNKAKVNDAFKGLVDQREKLRKSLEAAEALPGAQAKTAVSDLRKKIVDAESPYEALARQ